MRSTATAGSMPAGAQAAAGKCANIIAEFNDAQFVTSLAGIETMNNDISNDVVQAINVPSTFTLDSNGQTTAQSGAVAQLDAVLDALLDPQEFDLRDIG